MDLNSLLKNFLGGEADPSSTNAQSGSFDVSTLTEKAKGLAQNVTQGGINSFAGGAVAGGLLSLLLSNGKARDIAGGALGYGGAALLGALAHNAYRNYKADNLSTKSLINEQHQAAERGDFNTTLIKGMIAAAKSDGHIDTKEQQKIFSEIEKMNLPQDQKSLIFDSLLKPIDLKELTTNIKTMEQATEFYLASCLTIDPEHPEDQKYLKSLAIQLKLPPELIHQIHEQIKSISPH